MAFQTACFSFENRWIGILAFSVKDSVGKGVFQGDDVHEVAIPSIQTSPRQKTWWYRINRAPLCLKRFVPPPTSATCSDICHRHVGSSSSTQKVQEVRMLLLKSATCRHVSKLLAPEKKNQMDMI